MLNFCSLQVRKFVVGFVEEACKKDTELLPKVTYIFMLSFSANVIINFQREVSKSSVVTLCIRDIGVPTDQDPWICTTHLRIRILLFSSVTDKMLTKNKFSYLKFFV